MNKHLLEIENLQISFFTSNGEVKAVNNISYNLRHGEVMGIVGESGSGKSVSVYSILGLLQNNCRIIGGKIKFNGENILEYTDKKMQDLRGNKISMIFQNPMSCLNPVFTIGYQLIETLQCHRKTANEEAREQAINLLNLVGIDNPEQRIKQYPHELSGGMLQRVMIAMALLCNPQLLIADEPTTALDVTIQAQILEILKYLKKYNAMSIIFITHNLAVAAEICDKISIMYAGKIVEKGSTNKIFSNPSHPYTIGLLNSMPAIVANKNKKLIPIDGTLINIENTLTGCPFSMRCKSCMKICLTKNPPKMNVDNEHEVYCWNVFKNLRPEEM